jgi:hypothetical protein
MKLDWRQRHSQRKQRTRRMKKWRAKDQRKRRQRFFGIQR